MFFRDHVHPSNSIPELLAKENKKFQYSKVKPGGRGETYLGPLLWLEDAGIMCRCYNTDITCLPMEGNSKDNVFKVYTADIGLLIEMTWTAQGTTLGQISLQYQFISKIGKFSRFPIFHKFQIMSLFLELVRENAYTCKVNSV